MNAVAYFRKVAVAFLGIAICLATTAPGVRAQQLDNLPAIDAYATELVCYASGAYGLAGGTEEVIKMALKQFVVPKFQHGQHVYDALKFAMPLAKMTPQTASLTVMAGLFTQYVLSQPKVIARMEIMKTKLLEQPKVVSFLKKKTELQKMALEEHRNKLIAAAIATAVTALVLYGPQLLCSGAIEADVVPPEADKFQFSKLSGYLNKIAYKAWKGVEIIDLQTANVTN